jgi:excisionase family DNA binding protein
VKTTEDTRRLVSPAGLAGYLDVPLKTVYAWQSKGGGPRFHKVGRHVRYRLSDVDAWLESRASTA